MRCQESGWAWPRISFHWLCLCPAQKDAQGRIVWHSPSEKKTGSRKCVGLLVWFRWVVWVLFFFKAFEIFQDFVKKFLILLFGALIWCSQGEKSCGKKGSGVWERGSKDLVASDRESCSAKGRGSKDWRNGPGVCTGHCLHWGKLILSLSSSFSTQEHPNHEGCSVPLPLHQHLCKHSPCPVHPLAVTAHPWALLLQQRGLRAPQKGMEKGRADSSRCQGELHMEPALSLLQRWWKSLWKSHGPKQGNECFPTGAPTNPPED